MLNKENIAERCQPQVTPSRALARARRGNRCIVVQDCSRIMNAP